MQIPVAKAAEWYETIPFADGITLVHEPWIKEFFRCNMWLVTGSDRDLLVDAGLGAVPLRASVPALNGRPLTLVMSHTHYDHIGSAHEFDDRLAHAAEAGIAADPSPWATLFEKYASGSSDGSMFMALPPGWSARDYAIAPAPATGLLADGEKIDLGDRVLTVLHTPGHSPGHLSLFEERTGTLIAQDVVYDGSPLVTDCYHSDIDVYVETMRMLRGLDPVIVHGGHGPSFGRTRFRQLIDDFLKEYAA
jgi:glyoxylase-like metal-dependent hydrolase (beta-lactamase superfamily II)